MALALLVTSCLVAAGLVALFLVRQRDPKLRAKRFARLRDKGQAAMQASQWSRAIKLYSKASRLASAAESAQV
jgi:outer membrane protein assembly factor BamD (BamD/ComL family)